MKNIYLDRRIQINNNLYILYILINLYINLYIYTYLFSLIWEFL